MMSEDVWGELVLPNDSNGSNEVGLRIENPFPVRGKKFVIGRNKDCNLHLPRKQISSRHCYLTKDDANIVWLYDTSLNGTFINKKIKVTNGNCHEIHDGDTLYLVHKKKSPNMDYYLTFQVKRTGEVNHHRPTATTSSNVFSQPNIKSLGEPQTKKMKIDDSSSTTSTIKQEPVTDSDSDRTELYNTHTSVCLPTVKSEPLSNDENKQAKLEDINLASPEVKYEPLWDDGNDDIYLVDSDQHNTSFQDGNENITDDAATVELRGEQLETRLRTDIPDDSISMNLDCPTPALNVEVAAEDAVKDEIASPVDQPENNDITDSDQSRTPPLPVNDDENTATSESVKEPTARHLSAVESSISSVLQCSLCLEILYDPICLQPCMHCYCSACYSQWMDVSEDCPQCRCTVEKLSRNHLVSNLIDAYLKDNPEKKRSLSEIDRLNSLNTITADMLNTDRQQHNSSSASEEDSVPYYLPTSIPFIQVPRGNVDNCRQCPQHAKTKRKGKTKKGADASQNSAQEVNQGASSSNTSNNSAEAFVCPPGQPHAVCNCCYKSMPDRRNEQNIPPQQCAICKLLFCHLYWGCRKPGCSGCLNKFSDMNYSDHCLEDILNNNRVETQILFDCLKSERKNSRNLIEECLTRLDDGTYKCTLDITSSTVLCYSCALRNFRTLVYSYRRDIPQNLLTDAVKGRPDCHWGRNCRTQNHNIAHAERYNHICEQTRFR